MVAEWDAHAPPEFEIVVFDLLLSSTIRIVSEICTWKKET